jgi:arsenate reductase
MKRILILCARNSTISQMAEAFLKRITFNRIDVYSAGINPVTVNTMAIRVMRELGINIAHNRSKSVNEFYHDRFDYIITIHDTARDKCPTFQGTHTKIHKSIEDPEDFQGIEADKLETFRRTRDQIRDWLTDFVERHQLIS